MGDDLEISGGAGGVTAKYDDMLSYAGVLDTAGDSLRTVSGKLGGLLLDVDLAQAAVLCPGEVAEVEAALAAAATGPDGALFTGGELEITARFLRTSVDAYRFLDEELARLADAGWDVAGFTAGMVMPLLLAGGVGLYGLAQTNPALAKALEELKGPALDELQETLYDNPWIEEALTRMAPGMVQGSVFSLSGLLGPFGPPLVTAASDGHWPTTDYASAIQGLLAIAGLGGMLQDTGNFDVHKSVMGPYVAPNLSEQHFLSSIFAEESNLSRTPGRVQVITVDHGPGQRPSYIVQIPGTQDWGAKRGDSPVDLTTNVNLMAMQHNTKMEQAVQDAMKAAHIPSDAAVMLTGHSQGGITAAAMTTDQDFMSKYNVKSVVTGGSPIGRFNIPDGVSVMSLEHDQDIVPKLDGTDNPDRPNWITVNRELSDAEGTKDGQRGPGAAHATSNYQQTGSDIDRSTSATIDEWRKENRDFFADSTSVTKSQYQIEKK